MQPKKRNGHRVQSGVGSGFRVGVHRVVNIEATSRVGTYMNYGQHMWCPQWTWENE